MDYKVTVSDDDVDNIVLSQLKETQKHLINSDCGIPWFSIMMSLDVSLTEVRLTR